MKIIFVCILKLICISLVSSQSGTHVCEYYGLTLPMLEDFIFSVSEMPKRCDLVVYGNYYIFANSTGYKSIYDGDNNAIKSLVAANIPTYLKVTCYPAQNVSWVKIIESQDQTMYDNLICPLIQTINELQLTGILMSMSDLYDGTENYAENMNIFLNNLKKQFTSLQLGILIFIHDDDTYTKVSNNDLFDFNTINSVIDYYFISLRTHDDVCTPDIACSGTLITSPDPNVVTLELLSNAVNQSTMDKTKTVALLPIYPVTPNFTDVFSPYSLYCTTPDAATSGSWCIEHSQHLYDLGGYVKNTFGAIGIDWLEFDDANSSCGCQPYPATNTLFDGWDAVPITLCKQIS